MFRGLGVSAVVCFGVDLRRAEECSAVKAGELAVLVPGISLRNGGTRRAIAAMQSAKSPRALGHSVRSAVWRLRNSSGIRTSRSITDGTSISRRNPSDASLLTQSDVTEYPDQSTKTHRQASSSCSITFEKDFPT